MLGLVGRGCRVRLLGEGEEVGRGRGGRVLGFEFVEGEGRTFVNRGWVGSGSEDIHIGEIFQVQYFGWLWL